MISKKRATPQDVGEWREIQAQAIRSRLRVLDMTCRAGVGHIGPDFSCLEILTVLYYRVMQIDPKRPDDPMRDRFILSKGHSAGALYATLASRGFFPESLLDTYQQFDSAFQGHPNRLKLPGIEHNTGALGHGLSVGCGLAAGLLQLYGEASPRVYVLMGDGELQEGSVWEAAMLAAHLRLGRLSAIVDRNHLQQGDVTERTVQLEDLAAKWRAFGWQVLECDGHDVEQLFATLERSKENDAVPAVIIARTVKGRGVSFIENRPKWHHSVPFAEEQRQARDELLAQLTHLEVTDR